MNIIFPPPDIKGHGDRSKSVSALLGCCKKKRGGGGGLNFARTHFSEL